MSNIKISIIVPVYNVEKYLPQCLDSLTNQTLKDIEIICVDDKSTDNSLKILEYYAQKDNRIKIIALKENLGQGMARNIGLDNVNGEYIGFVDSDDWINTEMYEKLYNQAVKLQSDIVICSFLKYLELNGKIITPSFFNKMTNLTTTCPLQIEEGKNIDKDLINQTLLISPCYVVNRIYKTDLIKSNAIRYSDYRCYEDVTFILQSHLLAQNISYINKPLYFYRIRSTSTIRSFEQRYIYSLKLFEELKNSDLTVKLKDNLRYFIAMNTIYVYSSIENKSNKKYLLEEVKKYLDLNDYKILKKNLTLSPLQKIFSITNNSKYKVITIFGIKVKHNRQKHNYPVDLVYCWVNGNDEKWLKKKELWENKLGISNSDIVNGCRYIDNQELKYSLRSVAINAPWINHIYIVTDGQIPQWLDVNYPKITIVPHSKIMPADALPTFNSEAIEACLSNIPNLNEHFIYANDDFFIFQPVSKDFFFDKNGKPIVRLVKQNWRQEDIAKQHYLQNITYMLNLVKEKYGRFFKTELSHNMEGYRKSYFSDCKKDFNKIFEKTLHCKFRQPYTVQRILINLYSIVKKHCKYRYIRIRSIKSKLEIILIKLSSPDNMNALIEHHRPKLKLFCINDNEKSSNVDRQNLEGFLEKLFPQKQNWEL